LQYKVLRNKKLRLLALIGLIATLFVFPSSKGFAVCKGVFLNPVSDVCWQCVFPLKISGITVVPNQVPVVDLPDASRAPTCTCPAPPPMYVRVGLPVAFYEPARYVETVKDPFCFPSLGLQLPNPQEGFLGGSSSEIQASHHVEISSFQQAHWFVFPVWSMMELMVDSVCVEHSGFDVAYITEVDPLWNSDLLAFILNPEALLFANPVAQMVCIVDSVSSNMGLAASPLFWCMGSWGSSYPLSGHTADGNYVNANAGIAARMIYKLSREFLICDPGLWYCACVPMPIWVKHNYRIHVAKPVRDFTCHPIGRSSIVWGQAKNPAYVGDNFVWMIFRKRVCCAF
jgi:conjugal transfer pilus assembly protein TraU